MNTRQKFSWKGSRKGVNNPNYGKKHPGFNALSKHPNWKGGKRNKDGYTMINVGKKEFYEHRLVMERHLGRKLKVGEVVHHINEIRNDNRIENLKLESSNSSHFKNNHSIPRDKKGRFNKKNNG